MHDKHEQRVWAPELRADAADGRIKGYVARFNTPSNVILDFIESIRPGAFAKTIQESDVRALWQHNPEYVLGRTKNGTLTLREDDIGLWAEITPPDTQWARDAVASIRRGDVDQASFSFEAIRDVWDWQRKPAHRELVELKLFDVSPVTFPAYTQTSMVVRSLLDAHQEVAAPQDAAAATQEPGDAPDEDAHPSPAARPEADAARARAAIRHKKLDLENQRWGGVQ